MGNCTGTQPKKPVPPKTSSKVNSNASQKYSSNKPINPNVTVNNLASSKNQKPAESVMQALVGKKEQNNSGNVRYDSNRFASGALEKIGESIRPNTNQISGKFNDISGNIKDSYGSYKNVLNSSVNQGIKNINDYQSGVKDSFGNISNRIIGQSKDLSNPERLQQLNPTTKLAPILRETMDNIYLPTAAPYPVRDLKSKFDWALDTSDQNFRLQPESVVIPSINLKIS